MGWNNIRVKRVVAWEAIASFLEKELKVLGGTLPAEPDTYWLDLVQSLKEAAVAMKESNYNLKSLIEHDGERDNSGNLNYAGHFNSEKVKIG